MLPCRTWAVARAAINRGRVLKTSGSSDARADLPTDPADPVAVGAGEPGRGTAPAAMAGNGAGGPRAGLAALVPTFPAPASDRQKGDGDA
jgi:hypothetical protein